jgi:chromosome segregation ATPase
MEETCKRENQLTEAIREIEGVFKFAKARSDSQQKELTEVLLQREGKVEKNRKQIVVLEKEVVQLNEQNTRLASETRQAMDGRVSLEGALADLWKQLEDTVGGEDLFTGALQESNEECEKTRVKAKKMQEKLQDMLADREKARYAVQGLC